MYCGLKKLQRSLPEGAYSKLGNTGVEGRLFLYKGHMPWIWTSRLYRLEEVITHFSFKPVFYTEIKLMCPGSLCHTLSIWNYLTI